MNSYRTSRPVIIHYHAEIDWNAGSVGISQLVKFFSADDESRIKIFCHCLYLLLHGGEQFCFSGFPGKAVESK